MTMRVPEPVAQLIERGAVELADVETSFAAHALETPIYSALTGEEKQMLLDGSGLDSARKTEVQRRWENPEADAIDWQAQQVGADLTLLDTSATVRQVADALGTAETTVSRWYKAGVVLGFLDAQSRIRLPRWQFTPHGVVPGWKKIAHHAHGLSLTAVADFMQHPNDEVGGETPLQFLSDGGNPTTVGLLLDGRRQW